MYYWVRQNSAPPFKGPLSLDEIAAAVRVETISETCELLAATGQSERALKRAVDWRPLLDFVPPAQHDSSGTGTLRSIDQLVFVGLNGYAVALDRDTGKIVWSNDKLKSGYVTLLLDGDRLIVSTNGFIFCLDPLTGTILWNNRMRGFGPEAPTSLISTRGQSSQVLIQQAAEAHRATVGSGAPPPQGNTAMP